jgi:hypothetical protein
MPMATCIVFPDFHFFLEHGTEFIIGVLEDKPCVVWVKAWMKVLVNCSPQAAIFLNGILRTHFEIKCVHTLNSLCTKCWRKMWNNFNSDPIKVVWGDIYSKIKENTKFKYSIQYTSESRTFRDSNGHLSDTFWVRLSNGYIGLFYSKENIFFIIKRSRLAPFETRTQNSGFRMVKNKMADLA